VLRAGPIGTDPETLAGEEGIDDEESSDGSPSPLDERRREVHCARAFGAACRRSISSDRSSRREVSMADNPVSVFASFRPRAEREDALRSLLIWMVERTRAEPGCERYDLYEERDAGGALHLFERYRSPEALEVHRASDHYIEYRRKVADLLEEPIGVIVLDPIDVDI
jgi:quinol monooxygenase YgiN